MLARYVTGAAVQLVKYYQCMAVDLHFIDRHLIEIFSAVPLGR